jgi:hypothetical protein
MLVASMTASTLMDFIATPSLPKGRRPERDVSGNRCCAPFGLSRGERTMMYYWIVPEGIDLTGLGTSRQTLGYDR